MKMEYLQHENIWVNKSIYDEAETKYYENLAKASVTPLAGEVAKARQLLIESRDSFKEVTTHSRADPPIDVGAVKFFEKKVFEYEKVINQILQKINSLEQRVNSLENKAQPLEKKIHQIDILPKATCKKDDEGDEDLDLFDSDSDEENELADKLREERLAVYNAKKAKKPALIAKSNVILDVKPWDDETNMAHLEKCVRDIKADGLLWGASKLVPLAYGINKLQISCVVEDEKISIDWLQEEIQQFEDFVQSVDIAAFNKI